METNMKCEAIAEVLKACNKVIEVRESLRKILLCLFLFVFVAFVYHATSPFVKC